MCALVAGEALNTRYAPTAAATLATGLLCCAALLVPRRCLPAAGAAAAAASMALSGVTTGLSHRPQNTPGVVEWCALLLLVTRAVRRLHPLWAAALVALASPAAGLLLLRMPSGEWEYVVAFGEPLTMLSLLLAGVLGLYLRVVDTTRRRRRLSDLTAQRLDYARELHDFVAHHITAMVTQTKAIRYATAAGHAPGADELDRLLGGIEQAGAQAMDSMRGMVSVLREQGAAGPLHPADGLARVRELADDFTAASGTPVALTVDPGLSALRLRPELATVVHRLVQECLTNVRKHAGDARRVEVGIRLADGKSRALQVTVADDGRCAAGQGPGQAGYGVVGLTERVTDAGGTFAAGPRPDGAGWRVAAELPLRGGLRA